MIVVSDTTPLISLMKIGELDILYKLFGEIQIPQAVFNELVQNDKYPDESYAIQSCTFIKKVTVTEQSAVNRLRASTGLDVGESEAIILSDVLNADFLLMDELKGRMVAQQMGIPIMGTIGILMAAYGDGLITREEILSCIDVLKHNGRHISERLYTQLKERLNL